MSEEQLSEIAIAHVLELYKNHCRYLGYSIEENTDYSLICRHPRKEHFQIFHLEHCAGVSVGMAQHLPRYAQYNLPLLFEYVNELNSQFIFLKAYIMLEDKEYPPMINLSSVCEGEYNQKIFSTFLDNFYDDLILYKNHPKTFELWNPERI